MPLSPEDRKRARERWEEMQALSESLREQRDRLSASAYEVSVAPGTGYSPSRTGQRIHEAIGGSGPSEALRMRARGEASERAEQRRRQEQLFGEGFDATPDAQLRTALAAATLRAGTLLPDILGSTVLSQGGAPGLQRLGRARQTSQEAIQELDDWARYPAEIMATVGEFQLAGAPIGRGVTAAGRAVAGARDMGRLGRAVQRGAQMANVVDEAVSSRLAGNIAGGADEITGLAAGAGVQTLPDAIRAADNAGLSGTDRAMYVLRNAMIEGLFVKLSGATGLERIFAGRADDLGTQAAQGFYRRTYGVLDDAVRQGLSEVVEENLTELTQAANDYLSGVDPEALNPENLAQTLVDTTIIAFGAGAAPSVGQSAIEPMANILAARYREIAGQPAEDLLPSEADLFQMFGNPRYVQEQLARDHGEVTFENTSDYFAARIKELREEMGRNETKPEAPKPETADAALTYDFVSQWVDNNPFAANRITIADAALSRQQAKRLIGDVRMNRQQREAFAKMVGEVTRDRMGWTPERVAQIQAELQGATNEQPAPQAAAEAIPSTAAPTSAQAPDTSSTQPDQPAAAPAAPGQVTIARGHGEGQTGTIHRVMPNGHLVIRDAGGQVISGAFGTPPLFVETDQSPEAQRQFITANAQMVEGDSATFMDTFRALFPESTLWDDEVKAIARGEEPDAETEAEPKPQASPEPAPEPETEPVASTAVDDAIESPAEAPDNDRGDAGRRAGMADEVQEPGAQEPGRDTRGTSGDSAPVPDANASGEAEAPGPVGAGRDPVGSPGERRGGVRAPVPGTAGPGLDPRAGDRVRGADDAGRVREPVGPNAGHGAVGTSRGGSPNAGLDYVIGENELAELGGDKTKARANIDAIRTLKRIELEGRLATADEQKALVRYVGWGGLPGIFSTQAESANPAKREKWRKQWGALHDQLRELLTDEEWSDAQGSTINAHYTSEAVVRGMWDVITDMGYVGGRVVEPSVGVGHFFGMMPAEVSKGTRKVGIDMDGMSARITKQLYQRAKVHHAAFQDVRMPDDGADLFISNVPFANVAVVDQQDAELRKLKLSVHDYFFAKALKHTRPGGVVAFITSSYTMDSSKKGKFRDWIAERGDLIGAVRLPNTAFRANAGTQVTTDILFFQRRGDGVDSQGQAWGRTVERTLSDGNVHKTLNEYYAANPSHVLGEMTMAGTMRKGRNREMTVEGPAENLRQQIREAMAGAIANADQDAFRQVERNTDRLQEEAQAQDYDAELNENNLAVRDGKVYQVQGGELVPYVATTLAGKKKDIGATVAARIEGMLGINETTKDLLRAQVSTEVTDAEIDALRVRLNEQYDAFVAKYKPLSFMTNRNWLRDDPETLTRLLALEDNYDEGDAKAKRPPTATKAAIFRERTQYPRAEVTHVNDIDAALTASLDMYGGINLEYMSKLYGGKSEQSLIDELGQRVFRDPDDGIVLRDEYLSGNVRQKLARARAKAEQDEAYAENVDALLAVQPKDLTPGEITADIGSAWVPLDVYERFVRDIVGAQVRMGYVEESGTFSVKTIQRAATHSLETDTWGTPDRPFLDLFERTLNGRSLTVSDRDGKVIAEATAAAKAAAKRVSREFQDWLHKDPLRSERLTKLYNETFNAFVERRFDGSHLQLHGMAEHFRQQVRDYQRNAVWRSLSQGNTLFAHVVGAGKTWTMAMSAMEMRRTNRARKPMFVVPNHLCEQTAAEWLKLYPSANLLVASPKDLSPLRRRTFANRVATGDWDGVIIPQTSFRRMPLNPAMVAEFYQEQMDDLEERMREARSEKNENYRKELEKAKDRLKSQLDKHRAEWNQDDGPFFDEVGVDAMYVDEAHEFKNLYYFSKMGRISGVQSSGSQRSFDMYMKTRHLNRVTGSRGVFFATGTPIANSIGEMFTMQRYLQEPLLDQLGMKAFDAWAMNFGETVESLEIDPSGRGFRINKRFSKFNNLPELVMLYKQMADIRTARQLKLPVPRLRGGKAEAVEIASSEELDRFVESLVERADAVRSGRVDPTDDNMLSITNDGRKAAIDLRLIDPAMPDLPNSKVNRAVENVHAIWEETAKDRSTQVVWLDIGTPKTKANKKGRGEGEDAEVVFDDTSRINLYEDIRAKLVRMGIPRDQIAFIHEADTDQKKKDLFKSVNLGEVRVLIASTGKMGTGANIQRRLIAAHHIDAPWRPADVEQRDGRIIRPKNSNKEVRILRYVTNGSFDAYMWQTLETKQKFLTQLLEGSVGKRDVNDVGDVVMDPTMLKAIASGDPRVQEMVMLSAEVETLSAERDYHIRRQADLRYEVNTRMPRDIAKAESHVSVLRPIIEKTQERPQGDDWRMTVQGQEQAATKDAAKAIYQAYYDARRPLSKRTELAPTVIGEYRGHTLYIADKVTSRDGTLQAYLALDESGTVNADIDLQKPSGIIVRLDNLIDSLPPLRDKRQEQLDRLRASLAEKQGLIGQEWENEAIFREKLEQLAELQRELGIAEGSQREGGEAGGVQAYIPQGPENPQMMAEVMAMATPSGMVMRYDNPPGKVTPISAQEIVFAIADIWQVPVRYGKIANKRAAGIYRVFQQEIRLRRGYESDLTTLMHEMGHHLDHQTDVIARKNLTQDMQAELRASDYDRERVEAGNGRITEGFAEFVRLWATRTEDAQIVAPRFYQYFIGWMQSNPTYEKMLVASRELIRRYQDLGSAGRTKGQVDFGDNRVLLNITWRESWLRWSRGAFHRAYRSLKDQGWFLRLMEQDAKRQGVTNDADSPYSLWMMMNQAGPRYAEGALANGVFYLTGDMSRVSEDAASLKKALGMIPEVEYRDWVAWMYARHAIESHHAGKNPGISLRDAMHFHNAHRDKEHWRRAADMVTEFNNDLIRMATDAGVIADDDARRMLEAYEHYIPLWRVRDEYAPTQGLSTTIKRGFRRDSRTGPSGNGMVNLPEKLVRGRRGSGLRVVDPIESTMQRAIAFYTRASQQQVMQSMIELSERAERRGAAMSGWITPVPPDRQKTVFKLKDIRDQLEASAIDDEAQEALGLMEDSLRLFIVRPNYRTDDGKQIVLVHRKVDGQMTKQLYQIDPELYEAVTGMEYYQLPLFMDIVFGKTARAFKLGATGLNLTFGARNIVRDMGTFLMQSKETGIEGIVSPLGWTWAYALDAAYRGGTKALVNKVSAWTGSEWELAPDPIVTLWREAGGELATKLGLDRQALRRARRKWTASTASERVRYYANPRNWWHAIEDFVDGLRETINVSEVGPRLAEFAGSLENQGWLERAKAGERPPREVIVRAINAAADVTTNFKRQGTVGRTINQVTPFFNAALESGDKFVRTVGSPENWKDGRWRKAFAIRMASLISGSAAYALAKLYWADDEEREEYLDMPAWQRYSRWSFDLGDMNIDIPKPYEWGYVVAGLTEAVLVEAHNSGRNDLLEWATETGWALTPPTPFLANPAVEASVETWANWDTFRWRPIVPRWDAVNLEPWAQYDMRTTGLARAMGSLINQSPARIEHWLEGITGGLFRNVVVTAETATPRGAERPEELPAVRGFVRTRDFSESIDRFYDQREALSRELGTAQRFEAGTQEQQSRVAMFDDVAELMRAVRDARDAEGASLTESQAQDAQVGLARWALDLEPFETKPNPLQRAIAGEGPEVLQAIARDHLGSLLNRLSTPMPAMSRYGGDRSRFLERQAEVEAMRARARYQLERLDLDEQRARQLFRDWTQEHYPDRTTRSFRNGRRTAYGDRAATIGAEL